LRGLEDDRAHQVDDRAYEGRGADVGHCENVEQLIDSDRQEPAAIVLWFEQLSGDLRAVATPLLRSFAATPLIAVCKECDRRGIRAALAAGFAGVVEVEHAEDALLPCIEAALAGQVCVPRKHRRQIELPVLSTREKQILGLVVMGCMNGEIAERLYIAESTVKSHLSSAFAKLGVRSRHEAVSVILDPEQGLGMGILGLSGESMRSTEEPLHTAAVVTT
jgi:DNA-binding NarL/FixJ family response regulator